MINLREIEYFVTVADELHFGRAAERLRIAQPGLSRAIQTLELKLGVRLFDRSSREVTLTEAGRILLADARELLLVGGKFQARAKLIADGDAGELTFGYIPFIQSTAEELLRSFAVAHPYLSLCHRREYQGGLQSALADERNSSIDAALVIDPPPQQEIDSLGLAKLPFCSRRLICFLDPAHPLYGRVEVPLEELGGYPLATNSFLGGEAMTASLRPIFAEHGVTLRTSDVQDPILAVEGILASDPQLVWLQTREFPMPTDLPSVEITPPTYCLFSLIYRSDNTKPALIRFLDHARNVSASMSRPEATEEGASL